LVHLVRSLLTWFLSIAAVVSMGDSIFFRIGTLTGDYAFSNVLLRTTVACCSSSSHFFKVRYKLPSRVFIAKLMKFYGRMKGTQMLCFLSLYQDE